MLYAHIFLISLNSFQGDSVSLSLLKLILQIITHRRVMILLEVEVIAKGDEVGQRIGNPQPYKLGQPSSVPQAQVSNSAPGGPPSKPNQTIKPSPAPSFNNNSE